MRIYTYQPNFSQKMKKSKLRKLFTPRRILTWILRLTALGIALIAVAFLYYSKDLPDPNKLLTRNIVESTKIFARDGSLLYEVHGEAKRTLVSINDISPYLRNATVAIEDKDFYHHRGISISGLLRSVLRLFLNLNTTGGGGSTITQQFVKNAILTRDKTFDRKIKEVILAIAIDSRFSKEEILQLYLNEIPYGRNAYGIEAASQAYYSKKSKDLTLAEAAYLAAIVQSPSAYNPFGPNREKLDGRKDTVLLAMREQGYITPEQEQSAKAEEVVFNKSKNTIVAPHFTLWVDAYLAEKYGEKTLEEGGLKVYTTLDPKLQEIAERVVREGAEKNSKKYGANNAALVAIDPKTGQVLAMVGSKDYFGTPEPEGCMPGKDCTFEPNANVAISERQPGSSFKPYAYLTAFKKENGYSPATMLVDVVTNFGTFAGKSYIPGNYDGSERGPVSMRKALAGSLNIPAVKTLALVGVDSAVQTARDLGITSRLENCGLSLVLGGCEVKLIDHVAAYSAIANGGVRHEQTPILKVEDRDGKILEEYQDKPQVEVDPQAVYLLTSIMTDNSARTYVFGASSPLTLGKERPVAAKTGTTQNWRDGWTMGFTPSLTAGVWAGNNNGKLMAKGADGVFVAAPIWNAFMKEALKDTPVEQFTRPEGIQDVLVDEVSGQLPTEFTPDTKSEVFASYALPTKKDSVHLQVPINSLTGQRADSSTPPELITLVTYQVLHSERPDDPAWEEPVAAWAMKNGYATGADPVPPITTPTGSSTAPSVSIISPTEGSTVNASSAKVTIVAVSTKPILRVDLWVDGRLFGTSSIAPYEFNVERLTVGKHTLAVKATNIEGLTGDTSTSFTYGGTPPQPLLTMPLE